MSIDQVINVLATITLVEMMVTIGLGVSFVEAMKVARNWRLVSRAMLANYVCVPLAAISLLLLFRPHPLVAAGFVIVAVCPGAPYGPPFTAVARGNVVHSVGLMIFLSASSAIMAPVLLKGLLPFMAGDQAQEVDTAKLVGTLALSQFLPLCAGLVIRQWRPALANKLKRPCTALSKLLNLILIAVVFATQFRVFMEIRLIGYLGMLALVAATFVSGWLIGGPGFENRKCLAITTSVRNVGVSLVIAAGSFPGTPAVTAATAYALFQTVVMALVAVGWGRLTAPQTAAGTAMP